MKKVLILGANGQIATWVVKMLAQRQDIEQTLFVRDPSKLSFTLPANAQLIVGDALNPKGLYEAIKGHDIVYANLKRGLAKILALTSRTLTVMYRY